MDMGTPHLAAPMAAITLWRRRAGVKSVRAILSAVLLATVHQLAGCMSSLGLQSDGTYLLERHEEQATCDTLYKSLWGRIELIRRLPAKAMAEQAAPPPTAFSLLGRWLGDSGSSKGLKGVAEYDRERAHAYALQRSMREKKCVNVDLDLELAETAEAMARIRRN